MITSINLTLPEAESILESYYEHETRNLPSVLKGAVEVNIEGADINIRLGSNPKILETNAIFMILFCRQFYSLVKNKTTEGKDPSLADSKLVFEQLVERIKKHGTVTKE